MTPAKHNCGPTGQPLSTVRCQGCGGRATELPQDDAAMLRRGFTGKVGVSTRAFECPRCEAVIYEDEFTLGKFVPPQFKHLSEMPLILTSSGPGSVAPQVERSAFGEGEATSR